MRSFIKISNGEGTPIVIPDTKKLWIACVVIGAVFWLVAIFLWISGGIDEFLSVLLQPDADRHGSDSCWGTMAVLLWHGGNHRPACGVSACVEKD